MAPGFSPLKLCHMKEKRVSPWFTKYIVPVPQEKTKLETRSVRNSENLCVSETQKFWLVFPLATLTYLTRYPAGLPGSIKCGSFHLFRYSGISLRPGSAKQEPWQPRVMTRLTHLEQKWNSSFRLLAPRGNIYILDFDPMNANIV